MILGVVDAALTSGMSGSPSWYETTTSWPTWGIKTPPQPLPAQFCETRTQHELLSSRLPRRSQWNCSFTLPYLSV